MPVYRLCCVPTHQLLREIAPATHQNHTSGCVSAEPCSRVASYPCRPSSQFFYWGFLESFVKQPVKGRSLRKHVCVLTSFLWCYLAPNWMREAVWRQKGFSHFVSLPLLGLLLLPVFAAVLAWHCYRLNSSWPVQVSWDDFFLCWSRLWESDDRQLSTKCLLRMLS